MNPTHAPKPRRSRAERMDLPDPVHTTLRAWIETPCPDDFTERLLRRVRTHAVLLDAPGLAPALAVLLTGQTVVLLCLRTHLGLLVESWYGITMFWCRSVGTQLAAVSTELRHPIPPDAWNTLLEWSCASWEWGAAAIVVLLAAGAVALLESECGGLHRDS